MAGALHVGTATHEAFRVGRLHARVRRVGPSGTSSRTRLLAPPHAVAHQPQGSFRGYGHNVTLCGRRGGWTFAILALAETARLV